MDTSAPRSRKRPLIRRTSGTFFFVLLIAGFTSCQPSRPQIVQSFTQINDDFDTVSQSWSECLSVWIQVENEDGWEDVKSIVIYHPSSRLWWKLGPETWSVQHQGEALWLGTNSLRTSDGSPLPRGAWTIAVVTRADKKTTTDFTLPEDLGLERAAKRPKPVFVAKPELRIENFAPQYLVWAYDLNGDLLGSAKKTSKGLSPQEIVSAPSQRTKVRWLVFYTFDKNRGQGLEAGPYEVGFEN